MLTNYDYYIPTEISQRKLLFEKSILFLDGKLIFSINSFILSPKMFSWKIYSSVYDQATFTVLAPHPVTYSNAKYMCREKVSRQKRV